MPCLFAFLAISFPRVAIILLWLFTNFFTHIFHGIIIPVIGFLFLPLTLLVYAYLLNARIAIGALQLVILFIAVILDLGLIGGGTWRGHRRIV